MEDEVKHFDNVMIKAQLKALKSLISSEQKHLFDQVINSAIGSYFDSDGYQKTSSSQKLRIQALYDDALL